MSGLRLDARRPLRDESCEGLRDLWQSGRGVYGCYRGVFEGDNSARNARMARGDRENMLKMLLKFYQMLT
jgi:hypothetical protein